MKQIICILIFVCPVLAQSGTVINGSRKVTGGAWDASEAARTLPIKTGTVAPESCSTGEMFFKTDAVAGQQLHTCANGTWTQITSGGGSALPVDACVTTDTTLCVFDHFATGNHSQPVGMLGWLHDNASPTGTDWLLPSASQVGAIGIFKIRTSATTNNTSNLRTPSAPANMMLASSNFDATFRVVTAATNDAVVRVGLLCGTPSTTPDAPSGMFFEMDATINSSQNWFAKMRAFSADQDSKDMGVAPPAALTNQFQTFRLRRLTASTVGFSINGGMEQVLSYTFGSTSACGPFVQVSNRVPASQQAYIDYFRLKVALQ